MPPISAEGRIATGNAPDVIALTRKLLSFDTINPPGNERSCAEYLANLLSAAGFVTELHDVGPGRANLVARLGNGPGKPLCFAGHLDTVPLGAQRWWHDPFAGDIEDGKIYGRGATDMKGGVAAFVTACLEDADTLKDGPGVLLLITAGEETGCDGAAALVSEGRVPEAGALVVAEPTTNQPLLGHKGALWLKVTTRGKTAHGSTPEHGDNAVVKVANIITQLSDFHFDVEPHPTVGMPTLNIGTVSGGININSVPDCAEVALDIRSTPNAGHAALKGALAQVISPEATIQTLIDLPAVWTDPQNDWVRRVFDLSAGITKTQTPPSAASYFTDASVFTSALGHLPTVILGPGLAALAHQTDEYCEVERIVEAVAIYRAILHDWIAASSTPGTPIS
ncbi:MAG: M20 family metallopeptidase [Hoeflea sp.]|nr:M20 family metallopeptidase [Hoeflea sp.]